jgi:hypothetical protein
MEKQPTAYRGKGRGIWSQRAHGQQARGSDGSPHLGVNSPGQVFIAWMDLDLDRPQAQVPAAAGKVHRCTDLGGPNGSMNRIRFLSCPQRSITRIMMLTARGRGVGGGDEGAVYRAHTQKS